MDDLLKKAMQFMAAQAQQDAIADGVFYLGKFGKFTVNCPDFSKAILRGDPGCFYEGKYLDLGGGCYIGSRWNQKHAWKDLDLNLVCGSLGFEDWFEHGSPSYASARDFTGGKPIGWDWHVWLEDSSGRVYDIVSGQWHGIAAIHGKRLDVPRGPVEGVEKTRLHAKGLRYVAAPAETQCILLDMAGRVYSRYADVLEL